jgi:hypothetical protein
VKIKPPQLENKKFNLKEYSLKNFVSLISLIFGIVFLISVFIIIFIPDPFINIFIKKRITNLFEETYPEYSLQLGHLHYNFWQNLIECDSLKLQDTNSSFSLESTSFGISGISWVKILLQSDDKYLALADAVIGAKNVLINFQNKSYKILANRIIVSIPDSELTVDSLKYYSSLDDQRFFARSKYRQTRFRFNISKINIAGLDCRGLMKGNVYKARSINIRDIFADIFVNKEKPYDSTSSNPLMPNEAFLSIKQTIKLDSLNIFNGFFKYRERFSINAVPALITFNNINLSVTKIDNQKNLSVTTIIRSESVFMNSSKMKLFMEIPLMSKDFSLKYSGTFSGMDITKLNAFIEPSEHQRIKSGSLKSASYNISINSGIASGKLNLAYRDLDIAILNEKTNSENGVFDKISSFLGKAFVIRGSNSADENGSMKIGEINYKRNPQDYFIQYIWFALRSGVGDVVGF